MKTRFRRQILILSIVASALLCAPVLGRAEDLPPDPVPGPHGATGITVELLSSSLSGAMTAFLALFCA